VEVTKVINEQEPNLANITKIRELLLIYQEIYSRLEAPKEKMKGEIAAIRRPLESGSVENLKTFPNQLNNTQTKLVNEVRDLNIAYTKLRNAVK